MATDLKQQKGEGKCTHTLTNMAHTVDLIGSGIVLCRVWCQAGPHTQVLFSSVGSNKKVVELS